MTCWKSGAASLPLAAEGYAFVVDDFGQGQAAGDEGKGGLRFGVFGDVEAGQAAIEIGFEGDAVRGGDLGEGGGGLFVLERGVLLLAKGEQGGGVVGSFGNGGFEALEALVGGGCGGAADVVLEGAEADAAGCGEEGLLGDGEVRVHALGDFPGDGVFDVEEARKLGGVGEWRGHAELVDFEDLGLDLDASVLDVEAANDDEVRVEGLRDADGGSAAGAEVDGQAEVVEGIEAVVAADSEEAGGGETLVQRVGKGIADPVEIGLAGTVAEREDQHQAAAGLANVGGGVGRVGCGAG